MPGKQFVFGRFDPVPVFLDDLIHPHRSREHISRHGMANGSIDAIVFRPKIIQEHRRAIRIMRQRIAVDVQAHPSCDRIGHDKRR